MNTITLISNINRLCDGELSPDATIRERNQTERIHLRYKEDEPCTKCGKTGGVWLNNEDRWAERKRYERCT